MSTAEAIRDQALQLPPAEREELAHLLLDSLPEGDDSPITVDPDYEAEILRRVKAANDGTGKCGDGAELLAWLRSKGEKRETA
ncbi:MAG: addiction module protein [Pirellulaceae bacterium]